MLAKIVVSFFLGCFYTLLTVLPFFEIDFMPLAIFANLGLFAIIGLWCWNNWND